MRGMQRPSLRFHRDAYPEPLQVPLAETSREIREADKPEEEFGEASVVLAEIVRLTLEIDAFDACAGARSPLRPATLVDGGGLRHDAHFPPGMKRPRPGVDHLISGQGGFPKKRNAFLQQRRYLDTWIQ